jgi:hypothetical protein
MTHEVYEHLVKFERHCADGDWLLCPNCGEFYLHHDRVTIFERSEEDAPSHSLEVDGIWKMRKVEGGDNPSCRRDGVAVRFWCECCSAISELTIAQHKGTTIMRWRRVRADIACP